MCAMDEPRGVVVHNDNDDDDNNNNNIISMGVTAQNQERKKEREKSNNIFSGFLQRVPLNEVGTLLSSISLSIHTYI